MNNRVSHLMRVIAVLVVLAGLLPVQTLFAQDEVPAGEVIASGLNGPMGVLVDPSGDIWVIDSGLGGDEALQVFNPEANAPEDATYGMTGRIVKISAADGTATDVANVASIALASGASGGSRLALLDGKLYATIGDWLSTPDTDPPAGVAIVAEIGADGTVTEITQSWPFERDSNPYGVVLHAHPYGILGGPDGYLWVADAGGNNLQRIDPATGEIEVVAVFEPLPGVFPRPDYDNQMLTDPVPTGVAIGADGGVYVSLLSGAPFVPGNAKVMKVAEDGTISDYATGLTMLTDLRAGPDGNLYAVTFAVFGQQGPVPNSGAVIRIKEGEESEIVLSGLSFPTSVDFNADGDAFVTVNGVGAPGSGEVLKFAAATELAGTPVAEVMAAMAAAAPAEGGEAPAEAAPEATTEAGTTTKPTTEAAATPEATAEPKPETMPVTGAETNGLLVIGIAGLVVVMTMGVAFVTRRRTA